MKLIRKIAPLFFLSIFSLLTLHQVLPHVHHEHVGFEDTIGHIEDQHHDHENGHHHRGEEEDNNDFDFFDFLLGNHVHSISTGDIQKVKNVVTQKVANENVAVNTSYELPILSPINWSVKKSKLGKAPPDFSNKVYLSSSFLRGPPALG